MAGWPRAVQGSGLRGLGYMGYMGLYGGFMGLYWRMDNKMETTI